MATFSLHIVLLAWLIPNISALIDEEIVRLSQRSMELVEVLQSQDISSFERATLFVEKSDAALLVKEDDTCFVIFDTTETFSLADWGKNIDPGTSEICSLPHGPCCDARRGYERAYSKPSYKVSLEEAIIIQCYIKGQQVVLAGHSAGGATAAVAAVALSEINPLVITFGQPASLVGECPAIDKDRYYHWVNTDVNRGGRNFDYDPVPDLTLTAGAKQVGNRIVMGEDPLNVVVYTNGEVPSMMSWGFDTVSHSSKRYLDRLNGYQGALGSNGFDAGYACNADKECKSKRCQGSPSYWKSGTCQETNGIPAS